MDAKPISHHESAVDSGLLAVDRIGPQLTVDGLQNNVPCLRQAGKYQVLSMDSKPISHKDSAVDSGLLAINHFTFHSSPS